MSRDINKFIYPEMWFDLKDRCYQIGIDIFQTCVDRTVEEQIAYWNQGRKSLEIVNLARAVAKLPPITAKDNERKVTWTMNSRHLINLEDERLDNDLSYAIDFAIRYGKTVVWSLKADVNNDQLPDYKQVADIATGMGFISGFSFKNQDPCHIEVPRKG